MYIQYLAVILQRIMSHYIVPIIRTKHESYTLIFKTQHTPVILEWITYNEVEKIRKGI